MSSILSLLQVLINGTETNVPKADLRKKQDKAEDILLILNKIIAKNFYVICLLVIILCFILFVFCCFWIVGASGVESGNYYYHVQEVI